MKRAREEGLKISVPGTASVACFSNLIFVLDRKMMVFDITAVKVELVL